jgi:hypothetical protein
MVATMDSLFPLTASYVPANHGAAGWLYVFSNYAMPDCVKIGFTSKGVLERLQDLQAQTANPGKFVPELWYQTTSVKQHEANVFAILKPFRWNKKREWFAGSPEFAYYKLKEYFAREPDWVSAGLKELLGK